MKTIVIFDTTPTPNSDGIVSNGGCDVVNVSTGIGIELLKKVVEENIPAVNHKEVTTTKKIIRTVRYECPCCPTDLDALVEVTCTGLMVAECKKVEGLYSVKIHSHGQDWMRITVEKFSSKIVDQITIRGRLSKKNYNSIRR